MSKDKPYVKVTERIYSHANRFFNLSLDTMPVSLEIHLTNICNNDCSFCFYKDDRYKSDRPDFLPTDKVLNTIEDFAKGGGLSIVLSGGGEPTLHPDFAKIFKKINDVGLDVGVITNGLRIDKEIKEALLSTKWVKVSLHASNADQYKIQTRSSASYDKVVENIKGLVNNKTMDTKISVGCVINSHNENDIEIMDFFSNAVYNLGVDYVLFRPYIGEDGSLSITRNKEDFLKVGKKIQQVASENNVFTNFGSFIRDLGTEKIYPQGYCPVVESGLLGAITNDGECYLCLPTANNFDNNSIGSILQDSFKNIWEGDRRKHIVNNLTELKCPSCKYEKMFPIVDKIKKEGYDSSNLKKDVHWKFL